jgi:hypothetical protein
MPSYLDFDSTKRFRDYVLGKTLNQPNGPQTFNSGNYSIQNLSDSANINPGTVVDNRTQMLQLPQTGNVFKPLEFSVTENIDTLPRRANLSLYPYFQLQNHNLISVFRQNNLDSESELMKFAGKYLLSNNGPVYSRISQNIERQTNGRLRIADALNGSISTASNIVTGREPLVAPDYSITVAKTLPGKIIDFVQVAAGVEFPFSEIPGQYLSDPRNPVNVRPTPKTELGKVFQDVTGVLGSLIGIKRRQSPSRKPSDVMIEYLGGGQKSVLYDLLSYSKYSPNYTTSARSQNTSKIFNFVDKVAQGVKDLLGVEAPRGEAYIGDDRGNDVKYAMNDFNDIPVRSNYFLSLMFDPVQAELFQRKRNYSEGGSITGKLTWISRNSKNELGANNKEWANQQTDLDDSQSTSFDFRQDSILGYTQEILDSLPSNGGEARSHVANVIDQTSRIFREGDVLLSRGSAVKYIDKFGGESGVEYCRVWTKDRSYLNYSDTMKRTQNIRKYDDSILDRTWNLNIAPISNGGKDFTESTNIKPRGDGFYAKKYMFSIENLAWKTSNTPGFTVNDLPYCERGNNGGRVMWFPPYDLKVSEQNTARWESNTFLGRPEPIYTYQNTERSGQVSFKVVVDHPSVLNLLVREHFKGMSDEESENYINAFFAGCEEIDFYDLITRYREITPDDAKSITDYLNGKKDPDRIKEFKTVTTGDVPKKEPPVLKDNSEKVNLTVSLNFANDWPKKVGSDEFKGAIYTSEYNRSIGDTGWLNSTTSNLNSILDEILSGTSYNTANAIHDKKILFGKDIPTGETLTYKNQVVADLNKEINEAQSGFTKYETQTTTLKTDIEAGLVKNLSVQIGSSCSALADNNYNFRLSIRRTYSIILDFLDKIKKDVDAKSILDSKWPSSFSGNATQQTNFDLEITLKELGYSESDGKINFRTISSGELASNKNRDCSNSEFKYGIGNSNNNDISLKVVSPVAFGCRQSAVIFEYTKTTKPDPSQSTPEPDPTIKTRLEPTDGPTNPPSSNKPPIDLMKRIIMKTLSECYYFQKLEESDPVVFKTLREKLKYFHPAFHSTTPEGLNSRLTFLLQCIRPGDTIPIKGLSDVSDLNARNTSFGPPPICILRVGDFYHSKVIIRDVNITFEDATWDLNPEGIGVQPMIANVSLQVNFIGGQGLSKPVERLQNALSSNFYANTEMYDERSINTAETINGQKREEFTREFLEKIRETLPKIEDKPNNSKGDNFSEGYIGKLQSTNLVYTELVDDVYKSTENYFEKIQSFYNEIVKEYGPSISSFILHPNYREIKQYDIYNTTSSSAGLNIDLFGEYPTNRQLSYYVKVLKESMLKTLLTTDICQMMGLDDVLPVPKQNKANELLQPYFKTTIETKINSITDKVQILLSGSDGFIKQRDEVIESLDKVNFLVKYGYDAKITGTTVTKCVLSGFTYNLIYDEYENCIEHFTNNTNKLYEDLDTTINYNNPTITTSVLSELLSVLLKETDKEGFKNVFKIDTSIFDTNTMNKIERKYDSFISDSIKDKRFRLKKLKKRKNNKEISFAKSTESEVTDDAVKSEVKKLKDKNKTQPINNKLNYFNS